MLPDEPKYITITAIQEFAEMNKREYFWQAPRTEIRHKHPAKILIWKGMSIRNMPLQLCSPATEKEKIQILQQDLNKLAKKLTLQSSPAGLENLTLKVAQTENQMRKYRDEPTRMLKAAPAFASRGRGKVLVPSGAGVNVLQLPVWRGLGYHIGLGKYPLRYMILYTHMCIYIYAYTQYTHVYMYT